MEDRLESSTFEILMNIDRKLCNFDLNCNLEYSETLQKLQVHLGIFDKIKTISIIEACFYLLLIIFSFLFYLQPLNHITSIECFHKLEEVFYKYKDCICIDTEKSLILTLVEKKVE